MAGSGSATLISIRCSRAAGLSSASARLRFVAPARQALPPERIEQPIFAGLTAYRGFLAEDDWSSLPTLNAALAPLRHRVTGKSLSLVAQESTAGDPMHYELRIFERGEIATRSDNWHDLFNALIWKTYPAIKSALNVGQAEDVVRIGLQKRTRAQYAMTQFDEAGAVVVLRDPGLLRLWDAHDWAGLFLDQRQAWSDGRISLSVFGHALFEHALVPELFLVAKTLVFFDDSGSEGIANLDECAAAMIARSHCLRDPQELRPLPLAGIPGWYRARQDAAFYRDAPCFRPLRPRRKYPEPLLFVRSGSQKIAL